MRIMIDDGYPIVENWIYSIGAQAGALIVGEIADNYTGEGKDADSSKPYVHWKCLACGANSTDPGQHPKRLDRIKTGAQGGIIYETGNYDAGVRSCGCKQRKSFKAANTQGVTISKHIDTTYGGASIIAETDYVDSNRSKIVLCQCTKCSNIFPTTRRSSKKTCGCTQGSPYSGNLDDYRENHKIKSSGERHISKILDALKIKYTTEKKFNDCLGDNDFTALPFDFYIEDVNTGKKLIIEVDGEQHFHANSFHGGEKGFEKRRRYDLIKDKYCFSNNISLIRLPYSEVFNITKNNFSTKFKEFIITPENEQEYYSRS